MLITIDTEAVLAEAKACGLEVIMHYDGVERINWTGPIMDALEYLYRLETQLDRDIVKES